MKTEFDLSQFSNKLIGFGAFLLPIAAILQWLIPYLHRWEEFETIVKKTQGDPYPNIEFHMKMAQYEQWAFWLALGGTVLILLGIALKSSQKKIS